MHYNSTYTYQPKPISLDGVEIPESLIELVEGLAKNAHDLWALQRIADKWTFGEERDDIAKKHPCLVPYEELPESEKAYDRNIVLGTVRAIMALGFTFSKQA